MGWKWRIFSFLLGLFGWLGLIPTSGGAQDWRPPSQGGQRAAIPAPMTRVAVSDVRIGVHADKTRIVLDVSRPVDFAYRVSETGRSVLVDLPGAVWRAHRRVTGRGKGLVSEFSFAQGAPGLGKFNILTAEPVGLKRAFLLRPTGNRGYRIVIDLTRAEAAFGPARGRSTRRLSPEPASGVNAGGAQDTPRRYEVAAANGAPRAYPPPAGFAQRAPAGGTNPYIKAIEQRERETVPPPEKTGGILTIPGLYLKGGAGFGFATEATNTGTNNNNDTEYELGYLMVGAIGIDLQNAIRLEAEMGYASSDLKSINGTANSTSLATSNTSGSLSALTFMGNLAYEFKNESPFTPFLMGGVGLARVSLNEATAQGTQFADTNDWVFGMHVGGGLSLDLDEKWALEASYRYLETSDPEFSDPGGTAFVSEFASHNFLFGARYKF